MDAKGRINIPQKHRDALSEECAGALTLTKSPHGCVILFPRPVWLDVRERLVVMPMNARSWQRMYLGFATDVEMDPTGRILIPPELREAAGLSKDIMMLGMGSHFEIWDSARLRVEEEKAVSAGMPDSFNDFSF